MNKWEFPEISMINEFGFDPVLRKFYGYGITGLVRENIQNSLDAKLRNSSEPVVVKINLGKLNSTQVPGFEEIKERIKNLDTRNQYNKETLSYMKSYLNLNEFDYISFEDENTKGLSGAFDDGTNRGLTAYGAYAYNKGNHFNENGDEAEGVRGGSHGVGKIASNAASIFHMMLFANKDEKGIETLGGTVHLIEHTLKTKSYRATGFYTSISHDGTFKPYLNENPHNEIFEKKTRGLKIIVPFLHPDFNDETSIVMTVCDSFLLSILSEKLIVYVNNQRIDKNSIQEIINSEKYFEQVIDNIKEYFTPLYYNTLSNLYEEDLIIEDKNKKKYTFKLYFDYDEQIENGRTGIFRTLGMKIEDHKVYRNVKKPYNALLVSKSKKEDQFLKSLENESHTQLSHEHINDPDSKQNAKRFINNIDKQIEKVIEKEARKAHPESGMMDTSDVIYYLDDKFKESMKKRLSYLNSSQGKNRKHLVKTSDTDEKGQNKRHKNGGDKPTQYQHPVKKRFGNDGKTSFYELPNTVIRRTFIRDKEKVFIDLKKIKARLNAKKGNLLISMVDGMGKEYYDELDLSKEYSEIEDLNSHGKLAFDHTSIKGIDISRNSVNINLKPKDGNSVKQSKLRYYLEV